MEQVYLRVPRCATLFFSHRIKLGFSADQANTNRNVTLKSALDKNMNAIHIKVGVSKYTFYCNDETETLKIENPGEEFLVLKENCGVVDAVIVSRYPNYFALPLCITWERKKIVPKSCDTSILLYSLDISNFNSETIGGFKIRWKLVGTDALILLVRRL